MNDIASGSRRGRGSGGPRKVGQKLLDRYDELDWDPGKTLQSLRARFEDLGLSDRTTAGVAAAVGLGLVIGLAVAIVGRRTGETKAPVLKRARKSQRNAIKRQADRTPDVGKGNRKTSTVTLRSEAEAKPTAKRGRKPKAQVSAPAANQAAPSRSRRPSGKAVSEAPVTAPAPIGAKVAKGRAASATQPRKVKRRSVGVRAVSTPSMPVKKILEAGADPNPAPAAPANAKAPKAGPETKTRQRRAVRSRSKTVPAETSASEPSPVVDGANAPVATPSAIGDAGNSEG